MSLARRRRLCAKDEESFYDNGVFVAGSSTHTQSSRHFNKAATFTCDSVVESKFVYVVNKI